MTPATDTRTQILTVDDVAQWLKSYPTTVRLHAKELGGFRFGKGWRFTREGVEAWIARQWQPAHALSVVRPRRARATDSDTYRELFGGGR